MDEILTIVSTSLSPTAVTASTQSAFPMNQPSLPETANPYDILPAWEDDADDAEFDYLGEGVGIEGDLDMEDDG